MQHVHTTRSESHGSTQTGQTPWHHSDLRDKKHGVSPRLKACNTIKEKIQRTPGSTWGGWTPWRHSDLQGKVKNGVSTRRKAFNTRAQHPMNSREYMRRPNTTPAFRSARKKKHGVSVRLKVQQKGRPGTHEAIGTCKVKRNMLVQIWKHTSHEWRTQRNPRVIHNAWQPSMHHSGEDWIFDVAAVMSKRDEVTLARSMLVSVSSDAATIPWQETTESTMLATPHYPPRSKSLLVYASHNQPRER